MTDCRPRRALAVTPHPQRIRLAFVVLCLIWSTSWFAIAVGVEDLPPFTAAGTRVLFAWLALALVAGRISRIEGGKRPPWYLTGVMGVLNITFSYSVIYFTERSLPSGITALLWGVFPLMMLTSGSLFLGERLRGVHVLGFVGGFLGLALLFLVDLRERGAGNVATAAILLTSPLASTITQTLVKKFGAGVSATLLTRDALGVGALLLSTLAFTFEEPLTAKWTTAAIASTAYLAIVATSVAFVLYYWILRHASSSKLSTISYVTPVIALAIGWFFRNEPLAWSTVVGALLVLGSVALAIRR